MSVTKQEEGIRIIPGYVDPGLLCVRVDSGVFQEDHKHGQMYFASCGSARVLWICRRVWDWFGFCVLVGCSGPAGPGREGRFL